MTPTQKTARRYMTIPVIVFAVCFVLVVGSLAMEFLDIFGAGHSVPFNEVSGIADLLLSVVGGAALLLAIPAYLRGRTLLKTEGNN